MRVTIRGHDVEGTAEEIATLLNLVEHPEPRKVDVAAHAPDRASPFVSEQVAYEVLTRRPLGEAHVKLLRNLDEAGEAWSTAPELQKALGLSTREFAGVLGAFGRRVSHTVGVGSRSFLDQYWNSDEGHNLYRLPPAVRTALRKAKVVP